MAENAPGTMNVADTARVLKLVRSLLRPKTTFLRFFPEVVVSEEKHVYIDLEIGNRQVAPFVHPASQAGTMELDGYVTRSFEPPTVKLLAEVPVDGAFRRAAGERIGGELTAQQRDAQTFVRTVTKIRDLITRREEVMAAEAMITGQVNVTGTGYQPYVVDFRRDPRLLNALQGDARWNGGAAADPLQDIEDMGELVTSIEGALITDVYMDLQAWRWARKDPKLKEIINLRRAAGGNTADIGPVNTLRGAKLVANMGDYNLWIYQDYKDVIVPQADGTFVVQKGVPVMPPGTVIGVGPDLEGVRSYGRIENKKAIKMGEAATELFMDTWMTNNPSREWVYGENAPLPIPTRPNACWSLKVFG
ncbi:MULTISPECIES: major capsid protein [Methylobacterium]|uniref:major capsid protein n=1 Tax=Methylobacterium TaxID=407 RepID=UPI00272DF721|nr:major capsid protein [Methylobacterium sp.]